MKPCPRTIRTLATLCVSGLTSLATTATVQAGNPPEIANIFPDYPGVSPQLITGEHFDLTHTEVWVWEPPSGERNIRETAARLGEALPVLPAQPPAGARRADALDVEQQIITVSLNGAVAWVKTPEGFSQPYLFNVAKPLWVSEEKAEPGGLVYVFGFGLRPEYRRSNLVLKRGTTVLFPRTIVEARALRTADKRLVYFEVPADAGPGPYEVFCHNSYGGAWGWRKAGNLEVVARPGIAARMFDVRQQGAKGDGLANDRPAIETAIATAKQAGGGIVFFPPGTYLTDSTLVVPSTVRLRGANRDTSIIQGTGDPATANRVGWFHSLKPPTAVVRLRSNTGLESLTVEGATWQGVGGYGLVEAVPDEMPFPVGGEVRNVTVGNCRLRALEEDGLSRRPLYLCAFHAGPGAQRVKLLNNEIFGSAGFGIGGVGPAVRTEIIGNAFHGGAVSDVVTINGSFSQSLIDANILTDTPGRICLGMGRHNYIRFNEIHQAFRGTWENAEEIYLVHGGVEAGKTVSFATGGSATTLADTRQHWKPSCHRDATVLVISGRGLGQYRRVADNTTDTLTVDNPWSVAPDATTEYVVAPQFVENAFFANLNNTPCRMSLWLDCIANQVEMQRDDHAKGIDLWGEDASAVDEKGVGKGLSKFFPAWYNTFENCWMDGSALWLGTPGAHANNAHVGYPNFGNYVVRNRIRSPHSYRTGFDVNPHAGAGISVGGGSGRAGTSHTIVADNFLASTYSGISVSGNARKTFLLRNEFDHVDEPINDRGARTVLQGNKRSGRGQKDPADAALADARSDRDLPSWQPKSWTPDPAEQLPPLFGDVLALKVLVSQPSVCFASEVDSETRQAECQQHLRQLFEALNTYDSKHGHLPQAAFYPRHPKTDQDSMRVLLEGKNDAIFTCPTCNPDLQRFGLNYVWNQKLSGRKLSELKDPANTWLLMDFVGTHDYMVNNAYCGHRRGVNILYADGSVKWNRPFSTEAWNTNAPQAWVRWAKE